MIVLLHYKRGEYVTMITIANNNQISITQHDTAVLKFELTNYTLSEGDEILFLVKKKVTQDYYDIEVIIDEFVDGVAIINLTSEMTQLPAETYRYAICVHLANGSVSTVISSTLKIMEGVHHG